MNKNLYKTTYEDQEIEYVECTEKEHQEETKRLKNLGVKFTTKIVNHLKKRNNQKKKITRK